MRWDATHQFIAAAASY